MINFSANEISLFPLDVWNEVFKASKSNLVVLSCTSHLFNKLARDYSENVFSKGCFGIKEWKLFGADMDEELAALFPIPLKMVQDFDLSKETLTFIPEILNGEPLILSSIDRFVSDFKNGKEVFKSNYRYPLKDCGIDDKTPKPFKAHWVILSKDVLGGKDLVNGTRNKKFEIQEELVKKTGYEIPDLIDVVVSIFMHHLVTGVFLYPQGLNGQLWTYTRVQEKNKNGYRIVVGGFSAPGLNVHYIAYAYGHFGAACARKSIGH
jgi:hypothetical protein